MEYKDGQLHFGPSGKERKPRAPSKRKARFQLNVKPIHDYMTKHKIETLSGLVARTEKANAHVSMSVLSDMLRGKYRPSLDLIERLAKTLGVKPIDLIVVPDRSKRVEKVLG